MRRSAGIYGLIVICLVFVSAGSRALAEVTVTSQAEFRVSIEQLLHALENGNIDPVQSAASTLLNQSRRTGWNAAAVAIGGEAQRLEREGKGPGSADWQRLTALCRRLLDEANSEPEREALRRRTLVEARNALTGVLAAPEYHGTAAPSWWQRYGIRILQNISRWLERVLSTHLGQRVGVVAYYIALGILVLPLFILAGYLIWRALQSREETAHAVPTQAITVLESPVVYWQRAQELLQRGELIEALKNFHLALLAGLENRGLVVHDRTRTNWEYLTQFRQKSTASVLISSFQSLNLMYDRTVFGAGSCDATYVEQFASMASKLLEDLGDSEIPRAKQA
jgi:hypothetical protein